MPRESGTTRRSAARPLESSRPSHKTDTSFPSSELCVGKSRAGLFIFGRNLESGRMTLPWTTDELSASGQVFEFRLWAALTEQSRGSLHVFLPLTDRGIDGLVHRLTDGVYIPVQAKGRSALMGGEVHLVVWADSLAHDDVMIVSGLIVDGGLGPTRLVVPSSDFKQLAELSHADGRPIYSMGFGMRPRSNSRWLPWLVAPDRVAEGFGISAALGGPGAGGG